jgi:hypothetical protein
LTGFWLAADVHAQPAWQQQRGECRLPAPLQQFLTDAKHCTTSLHSQQQQQGSGGAADLDFDRARSPDIATDDVSAGDKLQKQYGGLLLVDFGSMGCLGLLRDAQLLLAVLLQALQLLNW